jgi:hypothetical protein
LLQTSGGVTVAGPAANPRFFTGFVDVPVDAAHLHAPARGLDSLVGRAAEGANSSPAHIRPLLVRHDVLDVHPQVGKCAEQLGEHAEHRLAAAEDPDGHKLLDIVGMEEPRDGLQVVRIDGREYTPSRLLRGAISVPRCTAALALRQWDLLSICRRTLGIM